MSVYYSRFALNTYSGTPYFTAHMPDKYPLRAVLQSSRAFRRLPPNLRELAIKSKEWAVARYNTPTGGVYDIDKYYDKSGNELDPSDGHILTDEEIDAQWPEKVEHKAKDIPIPDGGFPDPSKWSPEESSESDIADTPLMVESVISDIKSRGREATAQEYGVKIKDTESDEEFAKNIVNEVTSRRSAHKTGGENDKSSPTSNQDQS